MTDDRETDTAHEDSVEIGKVFNFNMPQYPRSEWQKLSYDEQKQAFLDVLRGEGSMKATLTIDHKRPTSATYTAITVAPDYGALWIQLDAEMKSLSDSVLQGLINGSIPWERAGITIAEEIAQIPSTASPGQQIVPENVFRDFATAELDRRREVRRNRIMWAQVVLSFFGGSAAGALATWKLSQ